VPGLVTLEQQPMIYPLKLFRFIQMYRIFDQVDFVLRELKQKFIQHSMMINNTYLLFKTLFIMLILFHLFACCWIFIGSLDEGWRSGEDELEWNDVYWTSVYFVTTTATTIGYGDISGTSQYEKSFLIILEFVGICIFSVITGNIRKIKSTPTI